MRLGFIGLGDMGLPMARRLLATGHALVAWNRSADKLQSLAVEARVHAHTPMLSLVRSQYAAVHGTLGLDGTEDISRLIGLFETVSSTPKV